MRRKSLLAAAACAAALPAAAAPRVAVDIAPAHSIVAAVMAGAGAPDLVLPPSASPHGHALKPSEAAALQAADLVVWIGPALTPWLEAPLDALAPDAARLTLTEAPGVALLPLRASGPFEADGHEHEHGHGREQDEGGVDAHVWLDPSNAVAIAAATAAALARLDPANAAVYSDNAAAFARKMETLRAELAAELAPLAGARFFVFHDAYQYFETAFGLPASGSVALGDGEAPPAGRVAAIRARIRDEGAACLFVEPQFEPKLAATLTEGAPTRIGALDPLGAALPAGPDLYPALLRGLAASLADCLGPGD